MTIWSLLRLVFRITHLYGAVITGPVKELLKLQEHSWVSNIRIGEVRLWNWRG